jgi:hypothetical protein
MDGVEPAADGLTQILDRLAAPGPVRRVSPLVTDLVDPVWPEPAFKRALPGPAAIRRPPGRPGRRLTPPASATAGRPARMARGRRRHRTQARRKLGLAVAGAVIAALAGAVVLRQAAAIISLTSRTGAGTSALASAGSGHSGQRQSPVGNPSATSPLPNSPVWLGTTPARAGPTAHQRSCAASICPRTPATPAPVAAVTPSLPPSPSQSPAPTPTPTPSHHGHLHHRPPHHRHHPGHQPHPDPSSSPPLTIPA